MYEEEEIKRIKTLLENDLGFKELVFQREVAEDLYFEAFIDKGVKNRIRVKPQMGRVYRFKQGKWETFNRYKFECFFKKKSES